MYKNKVAPTRGPVEESSKMTSQKSITSKNVTRGRSLSLSTRTATFYHVTRQCNLENIARFGLNPSFGGGRGGISALRNTTQYLKGSIGKIHLTASQSTVKRYVDHFFLLLEKQRIESPEQCPVILKVGLPDSERFLLQDDQDDSALSFTLSKPIFPSNIKVAMSAFDNNKFYLSGIGIIWVPISHLSHNEYLQMIPSYPDWGTSRDDTFRLE